MNIPEFLFSLYQQGIIVQIEQENLKISAPKYALSPEIQDQLRERKAEIIAFLVQEQAISYTSIPLRHVDRSQPIPVSFSQQGLWLQYQLEGQSNTYNIATVYRLEGKLDIAALEKSLRYLIARHDVLRTSFKSIDGEPFQVIAENVDWNLDVRQSDGEAAEWELRELASQPFSVEQAPLMRTHLWIHPQNKYTLLLNIHHIISDGWSQDVLERELSSLYSQYASGQKASLPPLGLDYADYSVWQSEWLNGETLQRHLAYWRKSLKDAPELIDLPTDHPRPPVRTYHGSRIRLELGPALVDKLHDLTRQESVTLFMLLNAAYAILLGRYSRQEDLVIGCPAANRPRKELEDILGYFVNTLPLRVDLGGNPCVSELLQRVRQVSLDAFTHQDVSFEKIVADLHPHRNLQYSPIFQAAFVLENMPLQGLRFGDCEVIPDYVDIGVAKYDIMLSAQEQGKVLHLGLEYNRDLFEPATAKRMLAHYKHILKWMVSNPNNGIFEFDLLSESEKQQILVKWNDTATDYPREKCIHQLFEDYAEATPDNPAIVFADRVWTYRQLNCRANQLAHSLCRLGIGPEVRVGIYIERSSEMIIALLAILKAGGAYVPLDTTYPSERQASILLDTKSPLLLTLKKHLPDLPDFKGKVICIDDEAVYAGNSEDNPCSAVLPENLAYIMYTSGSTGIPKGVCIPHLAVVRLVKKTKYATFNKDEVFLQFAPLAFDASTFEIWGSLLNGAKLVIYFPQLPRPDELSHFVEASGVTTLWLTAGLFHQMMESQPGIVNNLHQLLSGGDVLSPSHVRIALQQNPNCCLINGYGPTENTTFTCCHTIKELGTEQFVPIGRPIANTRVYILDPYCHPVPVGVVGELYIGGDGLAREYLNQPELTDQKFVPNMFGGQAGAHLYRTGDYTRWLPDGNIEFIGRSDDQVKLRGYRIELGEIEAALRQHPEVRQTVVLMHEDRPGDKRLVAYIIPVPGKALEADNLRGFLSEKLPAYMIPSAIVFLKSFPLTISGKVDRKVLPHPDTGAEIDHYLAPRNEIETRLVSIWKEILGVERVGIRDNFFELGGHSLKAMRLFSRIQEEFGQSLPLPLLFEEGTVEAIEESLIQKEKILLHQGINPVQPDGTAIPLFFISPSLYMRELVLALAPGRPVYGLAPIENGKEV